MPTTRKSSFFKKWNNVYAVVICFLVLTILALYVFTLYFE